ncbi:MAG: hypothetical protein K9L84_00960 [Candidatus Omnitrophica bacterium]|nr:hypothetical protein [Candidatus Omnitrophota bacterium]
MNIINKLIFYLVFIAFTGCSGQSVVLVAEEGKYKDYTYTVPFEISAKSKKETLADLGVIYEGMPVADLQLYGFGQEDLVRSYRSDDNQYLVFPKKDELGQFIIFVVQENKIIDWFQDDIDLIR